jgi:prephenate dehydrogenase
MTTQITIIGLGQIGTSIGLALAEEKERVFRCGHDPDSRLMKKAEKSGGFDKTFYRLTEAVKDADVVILALPTDLISDTLSLISSELKEDAIVIDTSVSRKGAFEWAKKFLPDSRRFISMIPAIHANYLHGMTEEQLEAHADLFNGNSIIVASEFDTEPLAIQTATELASLIKGKVFYTDPLEADGILAQVEMLPKLSAAALVHTLTDQPAWSDGRRMASRSFMRQGSISQLFDEQEFFGIGALINKENVLRSIDQLILSLQEIKDYLSEDDEEGLKLYLKEAREAYDNWMEGRTSGDWDADKHHDNMPREKLSERILGSWVKPRDKK